MALFYNILVCFHLRNFSQPLRLTSVFLCYVSYDHLLTPTRKKYLLLVIWFIIFLFKKETRISLKFFFLLDILTKYIGCKLLLVQNLSFLNNIRSGRGLLKWYSKGKCVIRWLNNYSKTFGKLSNKDVQNKYITEVKK